MIDMNTLRLAVAYCLCLLVLCSCGAHRSCKLSRTSSTTNERYVVVLSLDGFRADYQSKAHTPHLDAMDREGTSGTFIPCFPTLTFPNHYSMATGLHPNNHGLVANEFWDEAGRHYKLGVREAVENPVFYLGEPLWNTAQRQGLKAASYFWVGSETPVGGSYPSIWKRYDARTPYRDRADSVLTWLQLPELDRPRLIMWYLDEPDYSGHHYGPESPEGMRSIQRVDSIVGYFRAGLAQLPIAPQVDFIVVSDHGMMSTTKATNLADFIEAEDIEHIAAGSFTHIYPRSGRAEHILATLRKAGLNAMYKRDMPKRLHYGTSAKIGEIVVLAEANERFVYLPKGRAVPKLLSAGHGFDNAFPEMLAIFKGVGRSFTPQRRLANPIPNITLYPLVCRLLGIEPAPNDADSALADSLLRQP